MTETFIDSLDKTPFKTVMWPIKVHAYGLDNLRICTLNLQVNDPPSLRDCLRAAKGLEDERVWYVRKGN